MPRPALHVVLPVGISFYTFQAISYAIDVYWRRTPARTSLIDVGAFVSFFPSLLAGPDHARHEPAAAGRARAPVLGAGRARRHAADRLGLLQEAGHRRQRRRRSPNKVFALKSPEFYVLWAGVFAFCIQIYADFSAYADIARGVAKWLGFDLIKNFEHPYLAKGPTEFWRRWNISLSTWFRDYVFLPVAYRLSRPDRPRTGVLRIDAATWAYVGGMIVTMLTAGLWHGASWNYVIWGAYHGVLLALARIAGAMRRRRRRTRRWLAPAADRRDVPAHQPRLAVLPRNRTRAARRGTSACRRSRRPCSDGGPAPTCSCSPRCTRCRCGSRASGPSWAGATSWRRMTRDEATPVGWAVAVQALLAGLLVRRHPRPAQHHVARLHLLPLLRRNGAGVTRRPGTTPGPMSCRRQARSRPLVSGIQSHMTAAQTKATADSENAAPKPLVSASRPTAQGATALAMRPML